MASKSIMAPPDSAAEKLIEPDPITPPKPVVVAYAPSGDNPEANESQAVQRTEFGVDLGGANSLNGCARCGVDFSNRNQRHRWRRCGRSSW